VPALRTSGTHNIAWTYLGPSLGAFLPANGSCSEIQKSVFRLFNNRWMFNDSNHRYTTKPAIYEAMQQHGWVGEGVAFCLPNIQT
jgi:serine protease